MMWRWAADPNWFTDWKPKASSGHAHMETCKGCHKFEAVTVLSCSVCEVYGKRRRLGALGAKARSTSPLSRFFPAKLLPGVATVPTAIVAIHCLACVNHKGEGLLHLFKAIDRQCAVATIPSRTTSTQNSTSTQNKNPQPKALKTTTITLILAESTEANTEHTNSPQLERPNRLRSRT